MEDRPRIESRLQLNRTTESMKAYHLTLAVVLTTLCLATVSCSTTSTNSATASAPTPPGQTDAMVEALNAQNPFSVLKRGMTSKQVDEHVGAPDRVLPFPNETGVKSEIWVYNRSVPVGFREVVGGVRLVPYVDPFTGEMKELSEAIMRNETISAMQRIELLMVEGLFMEWKQRAHSAKSVSN